MEFATGQCSFQKWVRDSSFFKEWMQILSFAPNKTKSPIIHGIHRTEA